MRSFRLQTRGKKDEVEGQLASETRTIGFPNKWPKCRRSGVVFFHYAKGDLLRLPWGVG